MILFIEQPVILRQQNFKCCMDKPCTKVYSKWQNIYATKNSSNNENLVLTGEKKNGEMIKDTYISISCSSIFVYHWFYLWIESKDFIGLLQLELAYGITTFTLNVLDMKKKSKKEKTRTTTTTISISYQRFRGSFANF